MSDRDERELREEKDGITRRDFLDGAAVSAAGLAAAAAFPGLTGAEAMAHGHAGDAPLPPGYYPPTFSDPYTGQPRPGDPAHDQDRRPAAVEAVADPLHQGRPRASTRASKDTREKYDCVIVGAGASGISAAKWYQDRFGPGQEDPASSTSCPTSAATPTATSSTSPTRPTAAPT